MVKFKMKILLVLAVSACMTISMILYVSSFSGFEIFYVHKKFFEDAILVSNDSKDNSSLGVFIWKGLIRNPMASFSAFNASGGSQSVLVESNLVQRAANIKISTDEAYHVKFKMKNYGLSSLYPYSIKAIKSERFVDVLKNNFSQTLSVKSHVYNIKTEKTPVGVVDNEKIFVNITEGAVKVRSINPIFSNKSVASYFGSRRDLMVAECSRRYGASSVLHLQKEKLEHILVDKKNKALFCYIPKVACTNWKRMFMLLTGKSNNISYVTNLPSYEIHAKNMLASLQNYSTADIEFFIRYYRKIIFVRNPLERLLSAYRNKLEQHYNSSKYFQARFGKYIIKNFRVNPSNISLLKGDDVTFTEFVTYLVSSPKQQYNEHWQTMNDLCHPCFLKYDIIGKYDTLLSDSQSVLNIFQANFSFPLLPKPSRTAASLKSYYSQLSPDLIEKLYKIYEMDFRLFDYSMEESLGP